jgi:hypothetical protein
VARIEDLYDVPAIEIELAGGYFDGRRMHVREDLGWWIQLPIPPEITLASYPAPDVTNTLLDTAVYRWTGSIRDDGTRVYQFEFRT